MSIVRMTDLDLSGKRVLVIGLGDTGLSCARWLAAQGACIEATGDWLGDNVRASAQVLHTFPGLAARHQDLLAAQLALRPDPARLKGAAAEAERQQQGRGRRPAERDVAVGRHPSRQNTENLTRRLRLCRGDRVLDRGVGQFVVNGVHGSVSPHGLRVRTRQALHCV